MFMVFFNTIIVLKLKYVNIKIKNVNILIKNINLRDIFIKFIMFYIDV